MPIAFEPGDDIGAGSASLFQGYIITLILDLLRPAVAAMLAKLQHGVERDWFRGWVELQPFDRKGNFGRLQAVALADHRFRRGKSECGEHLLRVVDKLNEAAVIVGDVNLAEPPPRQH